MGFTFAEFFKTATGFTPYRYQEELAETEQLPDVLEIPTGAGKTEAAVLSMYMWRRYNPDHRAHDGTPRRLVYCLPMRVLVEQTVSRIDDWIKKLKLGARFKVITLMGGDANRDYRKCPETDMIIVGTQDMLLSRALNRGYNMSMFQWPVEFGLLNNDCLWVADEIQLMHNGLATTAQLEAFRGSMGTFGPHKTVWMSATVDPRWLNTPDFDYKVCKRGLADEDLKNTEFLKRHDAAKKLELLELPGHRDEYSSKDAEAIVERHVRGSITLVIVNTVKRAQSLFKEIQKTRHKAMIVHSRFRKGERDGINNRLKELVDGKETDIIVVSTQVVEAGIDMSARTLVTEMAPWSSMVQRFGRCNRRGRYTDSKIYVIDVPEKHYAPYDAGDIEHARSRINDRIGRSVSPRGLSGGIDRPMEYDAIIRRPDILGLFDTGPDLSGNYTDVSRFVRSLEDSADVGVLWRDWGDGQRPAGRVRGREICSVPIGGLKKMKKDAWTYSPLSGEWEKLATDPYPGQTVLLHSKSGGYDSTVGFDPSSSKPVSEPAIQNNPASGEGEVRTQKDDGREDSHDGDLQSESSGWVTLNDHTVDVISEAEKITGRLAYLKDVKDSIKTAAKYHDTGKAHRVFQETMLRKAGNEVSRGELWAKCPHSNLRHRRPNFRHEAVSAVAFQKLDLGIGQSDADLVSYLIASHHGKMRLAMRSLPEKRGGTYANPGGDWILGLSTDGPETLKVFLSAGAKQAKQGSKETLVEEGIAAEVTVDAAMARIGRRGEERSWSQIALGQLESMGPFRLAYLEAVLRAADSRASEMEER